MSQSSRRDFLKTTGVVAAAASMGRHLMAAPLHAPIGLQLYSVRNLLPRDFDGTLHALAGFGYRVVEAAGFYNKSAADWRHAMSQAGLRCVSAHYPLAQIKGHENEIIEYGHAIGLDYMICSWVGMHRDPANKSSKLSLDDWRWAADQFNAFGEKVKAAGMQFGYHNHDIEFVREDGVMYFDELLKRTDPRLVIFEMDCGWVCAAGQDPVKYLKAAPQRFPLLHVKDMAKGPGGDWHSVVMGTGVVDYHPILKAATGLKYYFIEQEEFVGDPLSELHQDAEYMQNFRA